MVQERRTKAQSWAGGYGLPFVQAARGIAARKYWAGAAWRPLGKKNADKAAEWAASQAGAAGGTLQGYTSLAGAGAQYASYWTPQEVRQADANEQAKKRGP
jgi:hypothetical protein